MQEQHHLGEGWTRSHVDYKTDAAAIAYYVPLIAAWSTMWLPAKPLLDAQASGSSVHGEHQPFHVAAERHAATGTWDQTSSDQSGCLDFYMCETHAGFPQEEAPPHSFSHLISMRAG